MLLMFLPLKDEEETLNDFFCKVRKKIFVNLILSFNRFQLVVLLVRRLLSLVTVIFWFLSKWKIECRAYALLKLEEEKGVSDGWLVG